MLLVDANVILRYLLGDNVDMADKCRELIAMHKISVRYEVLAEVVYVLHKVYSLPRDRITESIRLFLSERNVEVESDEVMFFALKTYASTSCFCSAIVMLSINSCSGQSTMKVAPKMVSGRVVKMPIEN